MLIPPPGILRPGRAALDAGLSFAQAFQNGPAAPFLARGGLAATTTAIGGANGAVGVLHGGHGLTGSGGYWGAISADNTYSLDTTAGTIIVAFVPDHASGSAGNRIMLIFGNTSFPAAYGVAMSNFFGNWIAGWGDGADKRVSVSATGLYSAGEVLTTGLTWDATAQRVYMRGVQIASGAAASYGSTAGSDFRLGIYSTFPWISSTTGGILYALAFDRALSAAEMLAAERDLWWWCRQEPVRTMRRRVGGATFDDTITDSFTAADSLVAAISFGAELVDSWTLAESLVVSTTIPVAIFGSIFPGDIGDPSVAAVSFAAAVSDSASLGESFIGGFIYTSAISDGWIAGDSLDDSLTLFAQAAFTMLQVTVVVGRIELVSGGPDATFTNLTEQQSRV